MGYIDDYNERSINKIPYDDTPISRRAPVKKSYSPSSSSRGGGAKSATIKSLMIISIVLVIINVALIFTTFFYIRHSVVKNVYYPSNNYISTADVSNDAVNRATSTSVAITCGTTIRNEFEFFNKGGSRGSGSILKFDGNDVYILTCYHVISNHANSVYILPYNWHVPIKATFVGCASDYDVAILKVDKSRLENQNAFDGMTAISVYDSRYLSVGEKAFAVGNSLGQGISVTSGVVSTDPTLIIKTIESSTTIRVFQTSAEINRGNSGGGLFNSRGQFIGLVNAKTHEDTSGYSVSGMNYAIPSSLAISVANNILSNGGYLEEIDIGIDSFDFKDEYGTQRVPVEYENGIAYVAKYHCIVAGFKDNSLAAQAGLAKKDYVESFTYTDLDGVLHENEQMFNIYSFDDVKFNIKAGSIIKFKVYNIKDGWHEIVINVWCYIVA